MRLVAEGSGGSSEQQDRAWQPGMSHHPRKDQGSQGTLELASDTVPGIRHFLRDRGWSKAGLGNRPTSGVHIIHQKRT